MTDIPPRWDTETPPGYAHRLLRLWATDDVEAVNAEAAMLTMMVGTSRRMWPIRCPESGKPTARHTGR